jgi:GTP-binding protein LepA
VQQRLQREFGVTVIATAPSVPYRTHLHNGAVEQVDNPIRFPQPEQLDFVEEPYVTARIHAPQQQIGAVMELCQGRRGQYHRLDYLTGGQALLVYELPIAEVIVDFFNELKSISSGYATVDFEPSGYRRADLIRVDVLVDTVAVDAFTFITHTSRAYDRAAGLVVKLKHLLPRRLFPVPLQATVGHKVIAREDLPPLRKNALAHGFHGSVSAKKRLAERQRSSRKRAQGQGLAKGDIRPRSSRPSLASTDRRWWGAAGHPQPPRIARTLVAWLVNGFVNETRRECRDGVERAVMAWPGD